MNEGTAFGLLISLIALYVIIGNIIYLGKAVPYLIGKGMIKGASFMPAEQFKHLREYAAESQKEGTRSLSVIIADIFCAISLLLTGALLAFMLLLVII